MRSDETRRAEIEARCKAATPGPWVAEVHASLAAARDEGLFDWTGADGRDCFGGRPVGGVYQRTERGGTTGLPGCLEASAADAEFIAHAREDVPWLLSALAQAEAERDAARAALARIEMPLAKLLCYADSLTSLVAYRYASNIPSDLRADLLDCSTKCRVAYRTELGKVTGLATLAASPSGAGGPNQEGR